MSKFKNDEPNLELANTVLPKQLLKSINHIFNQNIIDTTLVGGTALAGFYAGHRRSDDIDLFTKDENSFMAAILAVESLQEIGAALNKNHHSKQYYNCLCELAGHQFTIDIAIDENLFSIDSSSKIDKIQIAKLETIFKMKAATLVSRCSEKDLYDLMWLFENSNYDIKFLIDSAFEVDLGASAEAILISISGTRLNMEACSFVIHESKQAAYKKIKQFAKLLFNEIYSFEKKQKNTPLKTIIGFLK
jgi:hypothetical protein